MVVAAAAGPAISSAPPQQPTPRQQQQADTPGQKHDSRGRPSSSAMRCLEEQRGLGSCRLSNMQEDELLHAQSDVTTTLTVALEIIERYLTVQLRDSAIANPGALLCVLNHDMAHRGLTAALGLLMLLCSGTEARKLVSSLLSDHLLAKRPAAATDGPGSSSSSDGGIGPAELRLLESCNRLARRTMIRILSTRASEIQSQCVQGRLAAYLVDTVRDGEESEQLAAVDGLLCLLPVVELREQVLEAGGVPALLASFVQLAEDNKHLTDSLIRTIQMFRDARTMVGLMKVKLQEFGQEMSGVEKLVAMRTENGEEEDPGLTERLSSLRLQQASSEQDSGRGVAVMGDCRVRFKETNCMLERSHRHLQATILSLAFLSGTEPQAREDLCRRVSMSSMLSLIESTPFNLGIHWAMLHLLATLLLPLPHPHRQQRQQHQQRQGQALDAGLVSYLVRLARRAAKAWERIIPQPSPEQLAGQEGANDSTDMASLGATSALSTGVDASTTSSSGSTTSSTYSTVPEPNSIEEADLKLRDRSARLLPDLCPACLSHAMQVLFTCIRGHEDSCRAILREEDGLSALLTISGLIPGLTALTPVESGDIHASPASSSCASTAGGPLIFSTGGESSGSSVRSNTTTRTPTSTTSSAKLAPLAVVGGVKCDFCRSSQPFVHSSSSTAAASGSSGDGQQQHQHQQHTYPPALYTLLWASNETGYAVPLDITSEILRHEPSSHDIPRSSGALPLLVSAIMTQQRQCTGHQSPQPLVGLLAAMSSQLVPAPFPPDTHPGRAYPHNHLDIDHMGPLYHQVARDLTAAGATTALLDIITGRYIGHMRFALAGPDSVMPVVLAMRCLGRLCLSDPTARDLLLATLDKRPDREAVPDPTQSPEMDTVPGLEVVLLLFLYGAEYVHTITTPTTIATTASSRSSVAVAAATVPWSGVATTASPQQQEPPTTSTARTATTSPHLDAAVDMLIRQEAAGCIASVARHHEALQSRLTQPRREDVLSALVDYTGSGREDEGSSSAQLQSQCCRLITTVVEHSSHLKEQMARSGLIGQLVKLVDSPRSSVVIYACQALESCISGCLDAQEQLQQESQYRTLGRAIGNKVVPGAYSTKCAAVKAVSEILRVHNTNRNRAAISGLVGPLIRVARVEDDEALLAAAVEALEHLTRRNHHNWKEVAQCGGLKLMLVLCRKATHSLTRSTAIMQISLICKHCDTNLRMFLELQGIPLLLGFISAGLRDVSNAKAAMQALCALLDHECMRDEALRCNGYEVLVPLLAPDSEDDSSSSSSPAVLDPPMARDACFCLAKLAGESLTTRNALITDPRLRGVLQSLGSKAPSLDLSRAATVGWASMTRAPEYGTLHFSMAGWPDFAEGLLASYTVPVMSDD